MFGNSRGNEGFRYIYANLDTMLASVEPLSVTRVTTTGGVDITSTDTMQELVPPDMLDDWKKQLKQVPSHTLVRNGENRI
jgi:hypothetical protein